jgi:hypothetical protein
METAVETTLSAAPTRPSAGATLHPLLPRPDEAQLCVRADALRESLAPHATSESLDPRFLLAVGDLAGAIRCLEGLRVRGIGVEAADDALTSLADLLTACERAVADALPRLEAERRPRAVRPARSRRTPGSAPSTGSS